MKPAEPVEIKERERERQAEKKSCGSRVTGAQARPTAAHPSSVRFPKDFAAAEPRLNLGHG